MEPGDRVRYDGHVLPATHPILRTRAPTRPAGAPSIVFPPRMLIAETTPPAERERLLDLISSVGADNPNVRRMALGLYQRLTEKLGRTPSAAEVVQWLMDQIHSLVEYVPDPDGLEIFQSIEWTLGGGASTMTSPLTGHPAGIADCEDFAAAVVSLGTALARMGLVPGLVLRNRWWNQPGAAQNHVAAEACHAAFRTKFGERCVAVETTIPGARLSESPMQALARIGPHFARRILGSDEIDLLRGDAPTL